ncbi:MAG: D-tyrosyl-tRNA(Tyr) deacylase [Deltaproteobacteria bacterium]|nr:D-tyrosyl-tRNA(Tyr) deacylase [Deltaproteobacteria bacterium]
MRAVLQRVKSAAVEVEGRRVAAIGPGLLILVGCAKGDTDADAGYLAAKCAVLRIFEDAAGKMNLSVLDKGLEALVVSQFTLYGDARKGRRPSFDDAMEPVSAEKLVNGFVLALQRLGVTATQGVFGAFMQVSLVNDGPVTILLDSKKAF